ncbi:hypothetical protein DVH24_024030 [Malus domestica]|uniref:Uncharacterized protein n=1 Tax=Malus domestica TaxID=3750 RepID=A0A498JGS1_MALDO|nr:hypothetical protein DVH24_024030 [Malus domestica]
MAAISALSTSGYSAYAPSLGRFQLYLMDLKKYDIAAGRPKLAAWIEVQNDWIPNLIEKAFGYAFGFGGWERQIRQKKRWVAVFYPPFVPSFIIRYCATFFGFWERRI